MSDSEISKPSGNAAGGVGAGANVGIQGKAPAAGGAEPKPTGARAVEEASPTGERSAEADEGATSGSAASPTNTESKQGSPKP